MRWWRRSPTYQALPSWPTRAPGEPASVPSLDLEVGATKAVETRTTATMTGTCHSYNAWVRRFYCTTDDLDQPSVTGLTLLQATASAADGGGAVIKPVQLAPPNDGCMQTGMHTAKSILYSWYCSQFKMLALWTAGLRWRRQLTWQSVWRDCT